MDKTIEIKLPGADEPGFFKYLRRHATFLAVMSNPAAHGPSDVDEALEWLVSLVVKPDKKTARKLIEEMSATELGGLLKSLGGVEVDPNS